MLCTMLTVFAVPAFAEGEPMAWTNKPATVTGNGTNDDPYCIGDIGALLALANAVNNNHITFADTYFALTEDIDMNNSIPSSIEYVSSGFPIASTNTPFCGHFDGCGHSVNMVLSNIWGGRYGVFGTIDGATVSNLTITGNISSSTPVSIGGICVINKNGTIVGCINNATISGDSAGGICCTNNGGIISNCVNNGTISGAVRAGGICGINYSGTISNCINTASISAEMFVDGICGFNSGGTITNCSNTGTVTESPVGVFPGPVTGSILSDGNLWIIAVVAVVAVAGVAAIVIVRKKKKPALASSTNEE